MTQRHKPYSTRSILVVGLIMAIGFSALSLLFLYMQARNTQHRVAGEVISISEGQIVISGARGRETVLIVAPDVPVRGVPSVSAIVVGQHIMTRGDFIEPGVFEVDGVRLLKKFDPK